MKEIEKGETNTTKVHLYHTEEAKARVIADVKDRPGLRQELDTRISIHWIPKNIQGKALLASTKGR